MKTRPPRYYFYNLIATQYKKGSHVAAPCIDMWQYRIDIQIIEYPNLYVHFYVVSAPSVSQLYISRLRRVERVGGVPDVLGAVEDPEGEACQEVPGGEVAGHRA